MSPTAYDLDRLRAGIRPVRLCWFPRVRSTNDHALALRKRGELFAPAVVLAGRQVKGRGRGGNAWWSGPGSVTATFAAPVDETVAAHGLPLIAGLAVRAAVAELLGADDVVQLKWPNDLVVAGGRKLAGLLCERAHRVDLVGVGLNVNVAPADVPRDLRPRVTSLSVLAGRDLDLTAALTTVVRHVHARLARRGERPFAAALKEYDRHHALVGRAVTVAVGNGEPVVAGRCEGLDPVGRLLVRDAGGHVHRVVAGQVVRW